MIVASGAGAGAGVDTGGGEPRDEVGTATDRTRMGRALFAASGGAL
jgi:hypothetical protein